ncbi:MAG: hypothetical protein ACYC64_14790 [Armatimonadota bacterium]
MFHRPRDLGEEFSPSEDANELEVRLNAAIEGGRQWVYRDLQNPAWMDWAMLATAATMVTGAVLTFSESPWVSLSLIIFAALSLLLLGGLRMIVTSERVEVRLGFTGMRVLTLNVDEIESVDIHQFSPLLDFGGYGIRFNLEMKAYYFRGNRGVKLTTTRGKQYLIGSDRPESLAAVIRIARGMVGR